VTNATFVTTLKLRKARKHWVVTMSPRKLPWSGGNEPETRRWEDYETVRFGERENHSHGLTFSRSLRFGVPRLSAPFRSFPCLSAHQNFSRLGLRPLPSAFCFPRRPPPATFIPPPATFTTPRLRFPKLWTLDFGLWTSYHSEQTVPQTKAVLTPENQAD